jgi:hypothetical protein
MPAKRYSVEPIVAKLRGGAAAGAGFDDPTDV